MGVQVQGQGCAHVQGLGGRARPRGVLVRVCAPPPAQVLAGGAAAAQRKALCTQGAYAYVLFMVERLTRRPTRAKRARKGLQGPTRADVGAAARLALLRVAPVPRCPGARRAPIRLCLCLGLCPFRARSCAQGKVCLCCRVE